MAEIFPACGKAWASDKCLGNWLKGGRLRAKDSCWEAQRDLQLDGGACCSLPTWVAKSPSMENWSQQLLTKKSPHCQGCLASHLCWFLCLPCCPAQEMKALPGSQGFVPWRSIPSKLQIMNSFSSEAWLANIGWPKAPLFCAPNLAWIRRFLNGRFIITLKGECNSSRSRCCKARASTIICLCCYNWSRGRNKREVNKLNWVSLWCILLRRRGK